MAAAIKQIVDHFEYDGPVGCGFPTIVKNGVCKAPGNLHKSWVGMNVDEYLTEATGKEFTVLNDADAAGYASVQYGVGKGREGLVMFITVGTGLGSGAFYNGKLLLILKWDKYLTKSIRRLNIGHLLELKTVKN